jgi:hypothetical protein
VRGVSTNASLFDALITGNARKVMEELFPQGPQQPMPVYPALVEGASTTAGIGTADAGTPIERYWTVRYRYGGSVLWNYTHEIACDPFKAAMVVSNRRKSITEIEVVREINRDEFEHLTK